MRRHEMMTAMAELGLKGMAGAFDEAVTTGLQRKRTTMEVLTDLLRAEATHRHAASVRYRMSAATVKRYHYETHDQLRQHLIDFVAAYNFARRFKTLRGLTPYETICKAWKMIQAGSSQTAPSIPGARHLGENRPCLTAPRSCGACSRSAGRACTGGRFAA